MSNNLKLDAFEEIDNGSLFPLVYYSKTLREGFGLFNEFKYDGLYLSCDKQGLNLLIDKVAYERLSVKISGKILKDPFYLHFLNEKLSILCFKSVVFSDEHLDKVEDYSDEELMSLLKKTKGLFKELYKHAGVLNILDTVKPNLTAHLEKTITSSGVKNPSVFLSELIVPTTHVSSFYETIVFKKVGYKSSEKTLIKRNGWIYNNMEGRMASMDEILSYFEPDMASIIDEDLVRLEKQFQLWSNPNTKKINIEDKVLLIEANRIVATKNAREKAFYSLTHLTEIVMKKIAKKEDFQWNLLRNATFEDLIELIKSGDKEIYYKLTKLNLNCYYNPKINKISAGALVAESTAVGKTKRLDGMCAYPGKLSGKATLLANIKLYSGNIDILVAQTTNPELTPLLRKCRGIVTDMGGITCHAAIIAREMKIPCLVGTFKATKVISHNQKLNLNATDGYVTIED